MLVLVLSLLSAYICAAAFIVVLKLTLPRSDQAYGQTLLQTFADPFVLAVAATIATIVGLVVFPIALFSL